MPTDFDMFILLADMRTGSNFLESNLNDIPGLHCWGEAFNPHFMGQAGKKMMAGITIAEREANPLSLLDVMRRKTDGLVGFRFFHNHDPRILRHCMADPRCAKIILTRNPLESHISLLIARQTGQWRLGDVMKKARTDKVVFDSVAFSRHLDQLKTFQQHVMRRLQSTGQTGFYLAYEDVGDLDVLNGLAQFLGIDGRLKKLSAKTKVQNPAPMRDKVENYDDMVRDLSDIDHFALNPHPEF